MISSILVCQVSCFYHKMHNTLTHPPDYVARVRILASTPHVGFLVGSLPCSERFLSGYSGFPLSLKTNASKFQFDLERKDTFQRVIMNS